MPIARSGKAITRGVTPLGKVYFAGFWPLVKSAFVFLIESPPSFTSCTLWTRRSQTASHFALAEGGADRGRYVGSLQLRKSIQTPAP